MVRDVGSGVESGAVVGQYAPTAHEAVTDWLCLQVGGFSVEVVEVGVFTHRLSISAARGSEAPGIGPDRQNEPAAEVL